MESISVKERFDNLLLGVLTWLQLSTGNLKDVVKKILKLQVLEINMKEQLRRLRK